MILKFPIEFDGSKIQDLKQSNNTFELFTANDNGSKSHKVTLSIQSNDDFDSYIYVELNKNQARYIRDFLSSFIAEKEIDINAED